MQSVKHLVYLIICFLVFIPAAFATIKATEIINIRPQLPVGPEKPGVCTSKSAVVNQPGAWRCMVNKRIYDPCFTTAKPMVLLCNAKPNQRHSGFKLRLQKPLPAEPALGKKRSLPWMIKLNDGTLCKLHVNSVLMIKQQPIWYGCTAPMRNGSTRIGILGYPKLAKVWLARKVTYVFSPSGEVHVKQIKILPVKTVWQYKP